MSVTETIVTIATQFILPAKLSKIYDRQIIPEIIKYFLQLKIESPIPYLYRKQLKENQRTSNRIRKSPTKGFPIARHMIIDCP